MSKQKFPDFFNSEFRLAAREWEFFRQSHPDVADRLVGGASNDGSVKLLLDAVSFLAADIRRRSRDGWTKLRRDLVSELFPNFLAPVPAFITIEMTGIEENRVLDGASVFRSGSLEYRATGRQAIHPLEVEQTEFLDRLEPRYPEECRVGSNGWTRTTMVGSFAKAATEFEGSERNSLRMFVSGSDQHRLHDALMHPDTKVFAFSGGRLLDVSLRVKRAGFSREDNIVRPPPRSFPGYWILQEYFLFPERFCFVEIEGVRDIFGQLDPDVLDVEILFALSTGSISGFRSELKTNCVTAINLMERQEAIEIPGTHGCQQLPRPEWGNDIGIYDIGNVEHYTDGDWQTLPRMLSGKPGSPSWLYRSEMNEPWSGQLSVKDDANEDKNVRVTFRYINLDAGRNISSGDAIGFVGDASIGCRVLHVRPCLIPPVDPDMDYLESLLLVSRLPQNNDHSADALRQKVLALSRFDWETYCTDGGGATQPYASRILSEVNGVISVEMEHKSPYELRVTITFDSSLNTFAQFAAVLASFFSWGRILNTSVIVVARSEDANFEYEFVEEPSYA